MTTEANGQQSLEQTRRLRDDAAAMTEDLDALKEDAISCAKTGTDAAWEAARGAADKARQAHGRLCEQVASRPTTSLLVAAGIGACAGDCCRGGEPGDAHT